MSPHPPEPQQSTTTHKDKKKPPIGYVESRINGQTHVLRLLCPSDGETQSPSRVSCRVRQCTPHCFRPSTPIAQSHHRATVSPYPREKRQAQGEARSTEWAHMKGRQLKKLRNATRFARLVATARVNAHTDGTYLPAHILRGNVDPVVEDCDLETERMSDDQIRLSLALSRSLSLSLSLSAPSLTLVECSTASSDTRKYGLGTPGNSWVNGTDLWSARAKHEDARHSTQTTGEKEEEKSLRSYITGSFVGLA